MVSTFTPFDPRWRTRSLLAALSALPGSAAACSGCAPLVRAQVFAGGDFWLNLMVVMLPIVALLAVASLLHGADHPPHDEDHA